MLWAKCSAWQMLRSRCVGRSSSFLECLLIAAPGQELLWQTFRVLFRLNEHYMNVLMLVGGPFWQIQASCFPLCPICTKLSQKAAAKNNKHISQNVELFLKSSRSKTLQESSFTLAKYGLCLPNKIQNTALKERFCVRNLLYCLSCHCRSQLLCWEQGDPSGGACAHWRADSMLLHLPGRDVAHPSPGHLRTAPQAQHDTKRPHRPPHGRREQEERGRESLYSQTGCDTMKLSVKL